MKFKERERNDELGDDDDFHMIVNYALKLYT